MQSLNGLHRMRKRASTDRYHDMFCYRKHGEMDYLAVINWIPNATV